MGALGLGLAALGRPGYMTLGHEQDLPSLAPEAMESQTHRVLDAAWTAGVRHFDVARSYGRGEAFLATWLQARRPSGVCVSSKWGYRYTADWRSDAAVHEVKELSATHLSAQWAESRALLGPWLSVYQIHSATLESGVLRDAAVLDRLAELRESGVEVGLSVTGPRQGDVIDAALALPVFSWVQATWNVLEPSAGPALARAKSRGWRTIAKEGLANGRLSPRSDVAGWAAWADARGASPDALALAIALAQPFLDVVLSGAATELQLASNLVARRLEAPDDWQRFSLPAATYWGQRAQLRWS